jgi:hypothetical protein
MTFFPTTRFKKSVGVPVDADGGGGLQYLAVEASTRP